MLISIESHKRTCYFPGGCPYPLSPSGSAHGQCHHNGTLLITVPLLTIIIRHWFVRIKWQVRFSNWFIGTAHVWHLRETQLLEVLVFAIQLVFLQNIPPPQRSGSNNVGDWLIQSKKDGKDQESIQSSTTPDPGYQWESNKLTVRHHKLEPRGQENLQIYYSSASVTVLSNFLRALSRGERMLRG